MTAVHVRQSFSRKTLVRLTSLALAAMASGSIAQTWTPVGPSPAVSEDAKTNVIGMPGNPAAGAMRMVLPSPSDPNVMYAGGVNGGVWRTTDGGVTWTPLGDDLASLSIGAMAFDQHDPTQLWVGFGKQSSFQGVSGAQAGIIRLDTKSGNWMLPEGASSNELIGKDISRLIVNDQQIMVGVKSSADTGGVWRSTDGGKTFSQISNDSGLASGNVTGLVGDPRDAQRFYAAVVDPGKPKGVYRSDDGGEKWTYLENLPISTGEGGGDQRITYDIMLSVANDGTVVASVIEPLRTDTGLIVQNPLVTVYRSTDQGQNWKSMGTPFTSEQLPGGGTVDWGVYSGGQFNLHGALLVDPKDSTVVYISGDAQGPFELIGNGEPTAIGARVYSGRLFRGKVDASGNTVWEAITDNYTGNGSGPHADSRFMIIDAAGNLLQTDDGGVYRRTDPKSRHGVWQSLNGNLQTGEVHAATWNPLSHTVVTAMQDNGATMQRHAGHGVHETMSGGDGGIAAVNPNWTLDGERYAAVYTSSQFMGGLARTRVDSKHEDGERTELEIGVEKDGEFLPFGDGQGAIKPPRPRAPISKSEAEATQSANVELITFYPSFKLNSVEPTRIAVGGYNLYVGQDSLLEDDEQRVRIVTQKIFDGPATNPGFISLAYGAANNVDALLAGTGFQATIDAKGTLYYTPDVHSGRDPVQVYESSGIQAALFDRQRGTDTIYFSDGKNILRGHANATGDAEPYDIEDINGSSTPKENGLPDVFIDRRGLDHIYKHGVSALVTAGTHKVAGGNALYTLRGPANVEAATAVWDTRLGRIPNSPVFGLDYSVDDDVLLAYTMGRGAFVLYDTTTFFPEATKLVFGQAGNNSQPINDQLVDGKTLNDVDFSRPLIKVGPGALDLTNTVATYSGGTQLKGGLTQVNSDHNLGAAGRGLSIDGATLKFAASFNMDRAIALEAGGGTLHTNRLSIKQGNQPISGDGQLTVTGGGHYTLSTDNAYAGGTLISDATLSAGKDAHLGAAQGGIRFDAGRLNLLDGFVLDGTGKFKRRLTVNFGNGILDTANNDIPFAGSIDGPGSLTLLGRPMTIAGDVHLNATWNGPMVVTAGNTLRGTGHVNGPLTVHGRLHPGNSPGTMTAAGPVMQGPASTFATDIDGTGTGSGAGNYSRLLVQGAANTYTADGQITPILRGITGDATNSYSPPIGQDFTVIEAEGGILGSYASMVQPSEGLIAGSRFDTVYRDRSLQLYVTPASYANLGALGLQVNRNQQNAGAAVERARPAAGLRAPDDRRPVFDALAPVRADELARSLDQLGGAAYAPVLWADHANSKYLTTKVMDQLSVGQQHGLPAHASEGQSGRTDGAWAHVWRRDASLSQDAEGYGYGDPVDGVALGVERRLGPDSVAGLAFGYANGKIKVTDGMGSARMQNWQLMAYGSRQRDAWFLDGTAGLGVGQMAMRRTLSLPGVNETYRADLRSRHLALAGRAGYRLAGSSGQRLDTWLGMQYVASRHLSGAEQGNPAAARLDLEAGTLQSLAPSIGLQGSVPLKFGSTEWRASLRAGVAHELLDRQAVASTTLLGSSVNVRSASVGRTSLNVGFGLSGEIDRRMSLLLDVSRESATDWRATSANVSFRYQW
ncbi:MAG TPA: autotransporter domain-containing protein [Burkholderiaceae bacterium]|nr:autotransporter domain-containing protein [Burkholderiaceae bacterium]